MRLIDFILNYDVAKVNTKIAKMQISLLQICNINSKIKLTTNKGVSDVCTSERMKERRNKLGISADEVAKKIGVSRSTYFRYENGDIEKMPLSIVKPLAEALRTTPEYLAGWDDEVQNSTMRVAAHIDDNVTEEQMKDIIKYIEFLKSQQQQE